MAISKPIPVIDLFAGPGGLGEGFSSLLTPDGSPLFSLKVSVEKDPTAHKTLSLRSLFRKFGCASVPDCYYDHLRGHISREDLFAHPDAADAGREALEEARNAELGKDNPDDIDHRIAAGLAGTEDWVLIGGPPCQAYSIAGRSRRTREDQQKFESDEKHLLYREYLRIIQRFRPAVFIMENVKGMLSSTHGGASIFERIVSDLSTPSPDLSYQIRSLVVPGVGSELHPRDFVIEAERFGVPQSRHRVILFGIRSDVARETPDLVARPERFTLQADFEPVFVNEALSGLPPLRSRLSKEPDSHEAWLSVFSEAPRRIAWLNPEAAKKIAAVIRDSAAKAKCHASVGSAFLRYDVESEGALRTSLRHHLLDKRLGGVIQHEARSHMRSDLHRYLFASAYAGLFGRSPKISDFPDSLLPDHGNVLSADVPFVDRFRVQLGSSWSSTVVSHIAKDGHYFIHFDPAQCRSLTVREAARLQTFPDNYHFAGMRTEQYTQVGNAVPPLLARKIATIVADFMASGRSRPTPR